jgi:hypothetical protein
MTFLREASSKMYSPVVFALSQLMAEMPCAWFPLFLRRIPLTPLSPQTPSFAPSSSSSCSTTLWASTWTRTVPDTPVRRLCFPLDPFPADLCSLSRLHPSYRALRRYHGTSRRCSCADHLCRRDDQPLPPRRLLPLLRYFSSFLSLSSLP